MPELAAIRDRLSSVGQDHLLTFYDRLDAAQQRRLLEQIDAIDLEQIPGWIDGYVQREQTFEVPDGLVPASYYPADPDTDWRRWSRRDAEQAGEELIRRGKVACFTVAGGQGSRLGYDGPKGCYPVSVLSGKPLFQIFAEGMLATQRRYDAVVPWYIMTSPLNHAATVSFFERHAHFGLEPTNVQFFTQGAIPSFDRATGKMLLADAGTVATNPDGHGGAIAALHKSGSLDDMHDRGIEHISYFQVDNPHVRVVDPVFLGLHAAAEDSSGEFSSKMVAKATPQEKVGVFCAVDGRVRVIEYSDLPEELAHAAKPDGSLRFNAGSIAIHVLGVDFVRKVATDPSFALPLHRAIKKVPHLDLATGARLEPGEPNAAKLEKFIFDAIPLAENSIVYETDRVEEFAPVKNATGVDSIESSKRLQTERAARWLESAGVGVPRDADGAVQARIEISPLTALDDAHLAERADLPASIDVGAEVAL